jgi:hypothetical protein
LFGLPYDEERYKKAVGNLLVLILFYLFYLKIHSDVCELTQDLAILPSGDQTEIGER